MQSEGNAQTKKKKEDTTHDSRFTDPNSPRCAFLLAATLHYFDPLHAPPASHGTIIFQFTFKKYEDNLVPGGLSTRDKKTAQHHRIQQPFS